MTSGDSLSLSSPGLSSSFSLIRLAMVKAFFLGFSVSVKRKELGVGGLEDRGEAWLRVDGAWGRGTEASLCPGEVGDQRGGEEARG